MRRAARIVKGLGAFVLLVVLVGAIPWALWHFVGWPLPHHVPSTSQIGRALDHQGIPDQVLVDALAVVVWVTWASLIASLAVEVPAALSGRHASRLPLAGAFQPFTGKLVAAVIVACLAVAPRPGHAGAVSGEGSLAGLRPTATLTAPEATLTARPGSVATVTETAATVAPLTPAAPEPAAVPETYVVQRGDTLWGIAQRELGDPLRWSEIYQLNEGRPQPGGVTLSDPHWIDPGWTLQLPASATALVAPPPAPTRAAPPVASAPSQSQLEPPTTVPTTTAPATSVTAPTTEATAPAHHAVSHRAEHVSDPVRLPSGSVVAGSFAAGVAATIAIGHLRRRHAYRYRPPRPTKTWATVAEHPAVTELRLAAASDYDSEGSAPPRPPVEDLERRQHPELVEIGLRDGVAVAVELTELSGLALHGQNASDAVRAIVDALLVRAGPGAAEILVPEALAMRLLPGLGAHRAVRRSATIEQAATALEAERVMRSRWFDEAGASDAKAFRTQNPEHPLPMLLAIVELSTQDPAAGQWAALADGGGRLGMAVLFLGGGPDASTVVWLDESRRVMSVEPDDGLGHLRGVELFGLQADEAAAVLSAVGEAEDSGLEGPDELGEESDHDADPPDHRLRQGIDDSWQASEDREDRPVTVCMFGHLEVYAGGEVVATGLRARARDLLAWYMLHPSGSTSDEAVEALWPDTEPDRVHGQFWRSFSDLRSCLRDRSDADLEVLAKVGEHYRPVVSEIGCDLWSFQAALSEAARATDNENTRLTLRRAIEAYRGEFLIGDDRPWVEPVRQSLQRRALDAHLRLAELEEEAGHNAAAVDLLERAVERDRYAEEPYRRLMALHGANHRADAVRDVWLTLQSRLAELDLDVEEATSTLYRQLTAGDGPREHPHRVGSMP